jgi:alanyl-tRNA synthetase
MDAQSLRQSFLEFFAERGHEIVPSASLIPHDPSVLFTIAGMVPFKPYFVGDEPAPWPRATSAQKCFRTVDIDIIGTTSRHCTFFEMLGNFSFGDYFKQGAIELAWEFITETLGIDPERLWVTVHTSDDEAEQIWSDAIGVDPSRIQRMGEDNFWRMGDTGPCGPCSEIYYDKGVEYGPDGGPAYGGPERFVEIWNLVFMEFNRSADGSLTELPTKNIDTGAGLERLVPILNGTDSVFATDIFTGLLEVAQKATGKTYGADAVDDVALRIMADHGRAMTMLVSDGVLPSNEGRGYVLRRIVRRLVMAARRAGATQSVTPDLVRATIDSLGGTYPRLVSDADLITGVLSREEEGFERTLRAGMNLLEEATDAAQSQGHEAIPGDVAFKLHDTHGFPIELTQELASEQGLDVDRPHFDLLMDEQRARARAAAQVPRAADEDSYRTILELEGPTVFVGRRSEEYTTSARVVGLLEGPDGVTEVFLDRTPFYAEGGGQVGDIGTIQAPTGAATVLDTIAPLPGLFAHRARVDGSLEVGQEVIASIDGRRRDAIRRNHTATHLLHWALREVLGEHVRQQGSLVAPNRLRFDFSHHAAPTQDELDAVTTLVNEQIISDESVETTETSRSDAEEMGAIAFFGDKYGESVRVVKAGSRSLEFCGGTHVASLGQIGSLQIISEGSIGSNTRRIEAVTALESVKVSLAHAASLREVGSILKAEPDQVLDALNRSLARTKEVERERDGLRRAQLERDAEVLLDQAADGILVARVQDRGADDLRQMAGALLKRGGLEVAALGSVLDGKASVAVASDDQRDAREIVKELGGLIGGGGGGSPQLAVAGGKELGGLDDALAAVRTLLSTP